MSLGPVCDCLLRGEDRCEIHGSVFGWWRVPEATNSATGNPTLNELVLLRERVATLATQRDEETRQFKNFHRSLCGRFDYCHDETDWKRDLVSLEEHINEKIKGEGVEAIKQVGESLNDVYPLWCRKSTLSDIGRPWIMFSVVSVRSRKSA